MTNLMHVHMDEIGISIVLESSIFISFHFYLAIHKLQYTKIKIQYI